MLHVSVENTFTIRQTNIAKGIACILLLCHHLFYPSPETTEKYTSLFMNDTTPIESYFAIVSKVCVTTFLFLSGYGVNETYNRRLSTKPTSFWTLVTISCRLLWKLWANYFVIFLLFVPWQGLFNRHPYTSIGELLIDISGLASLFNTHTINATWWFMSAAIISYMIAPPIKIIISKQPTLLFALLPLAFLLSMMPCGLYLRYAFICGMIASEFEVLNILKNKMCGLKRLYVWCVCTIMVLATGIIRFFSPDAGDFPFAISLIVFSFLCISEIRFFSAPLELIGKHSANIFLFHTFLYSYNFASIVYAPKYAPLILPIFVVECVGVSLIIEYFKKTLGIHKGIRRIEKAIEGVSK